MTIQDFLDSLDANYFYVFLLTHFLDSFWILEFRISSFTPTGTAATLRL